MAEVVQAHGYVILHKSIDGEQFQFDIIMKNQDDDNCYAFDGWSYGHADWANPLFRIPMGTWNVRAVAISGNVRSEPLELVLTNNGPNLADASLQEESE